MSRRLIALGVACAIALPAVATESPASLTLYRADGDSLFQTNGETFSSDGYAVVHERRTFDLRSGTQDISIGGLPAALDSEALSLRFPGKGTSVVSQRLLLGQGFGGAVAGLVGKNIVVIGTSGQPIASGTLLRGGDTLVVKEANGQSTLIREYAALRAADNSNFSRGSTLQVRVDAASGGSSTATLSYPTSGLGWRAAYTAMLAPGATCRMTFDSWASIANRSGRDWNDTTLKLVAGDANRAKAPPVQARYNKVAMAAAPMADSAGMPEQATLADLRTFTLPTPIDLPDGSVTQTPLYTTREIDCERTALYENGGVWFPQSPNTSRNGNGQQESPIVTTVRLKAFDSLPGGYARVLTADRDGNAELLGEGRIEDTAKGSDATIVLGTAFDLKATREQTAFTLDNPGHRLDEAFRIKLTNASDTARVVTVREHPNRWRGWKLVSSTTKASKQTPDTLEFKVDVPANGSATLDYAVRYQWAADDMPRGAR
ncbi:hypothetical protein EC912_1012 [Luteibacter rhizovicinus]|uniref:DUF4139 domain-containing protein n=1 Tax=Luteibacter rhizovicinus TaxID=242606 RepID=A0A4R3YWN2_9GAMM|nr:DUF4139 domain-containing protein [Luteibacter rhizovicinus]TCV97010.1 hypothetical protein EC912_1012 [Luteibacter rhizovicinus]